MSFPDQRQIDWATYHATGEHFDLESVLRAELGEFLGEVGLDERVDVVRSEVRNEADREFA